MTTDKAAVPVGDFVLVPRESLKTWRNVIDVAPSEVQSEIAAMLAAAPQAARMAELEKDAARYQVARRFLSVAVIQGRAAHDCTRHADYLASIDAAIDALLQPPIHAPPPA